jgi:hypothetical protein
MIKCDRNDLEIISLRRSAPAWKFKPHSWSSCSISRCWSPSPTTRHDDSQNQSVPERQSSTPARESAIFCNCPAGASSASSARRSEIHIPFSLSRTPRLREVFRECQFRAVFLSQCSWECGFRERFSQRFRPKLVPLRPVALPCFIAQQSLPEVSRFPLPFSCFH